jgi:hypothetical protein
VTAAAAASVSAWVDREAWAKSMSRIGATRIVSIFWFFMVGSFVEMYGLSTW